MPADHFKRPPLPDSEAMKALIERAVGTSGIAVGPVDAESQPDWATHLIQQFNDAGPKTCCPHLASDDLVALWMPLAPDLLACLDCDEKLVEKIESRLGHSLTEEPGKCSVCSRRGLVRGVSIATGRFLLRGLICAACEDGSVADQTSSGEDSAPSDPDPSLEAPESLRLLGLSPIRIDVEALRATTDREDFDEKGWEMLARAGKLSELLTSAVQQDATGALGLDLDKAVIGGLLVRSTKLTRAIFDSTQADESEAHATLSRSLAETSITLRWLVQKNDPVSYRRFRADSLARWRAFLEETEAEKDREDDTSAVLREKVQQYVEAELESADLSWDDIPKKPNSWGPPVRQQFEDLDQVGIYNALFATHSSYVHPTWHEIRNFHLAPATNGFHLDPSYAGMVPVAAFLLARLVVEGCLAAASVLPNALDAKLLSEAVESTVRASRVLSLEFSEFMARGHLDDELQRPFAIP